MKFLRLESIGLCIATFAVCVAISGADSAINGPQLFEQSIRPLLKEFCLTCHSTVKQKGDLDLERFSSFSEVLKHPKVWQTVAEQLANHEMPPKDKPQPQPSERDRLVAWVNAVLDQIALARSGDPGSVLLRRLSNAEYTYTLRDITGIQSLDPAREFPVDGAAGEGFMNTGNALVMSPSLLTKYLDAAKAIAAHAVLLPNGIRFSSKTTPRDWTEEILSEIRGFYREFTDPHGGDKVNLQGIVFETNEGGRLPLEKYLAATLELRSRLINEARPPSESPTHHSDVFVAFAGDRGLSAKYLETLWSTLANTEPSLLLDPIRTRWRMSKPGDAAALASNIAQWQKALWKFASVGHIGKVGGPKAWMNAISPLTTKQEVRLKIPKAPDAKEVILYLWTGDAGDGNENDFVVWQQPRLVMPGQPDLLLGDLQSDQLQIADRESQIHQNLPTPAPANLDGVASVPGPALFGRHPSGHSIDPSSLCVPAPSVIEIRLPADLAAGAEFVSTGVLDSEMGAEGSVQIQVLTTKPELESGLLPSSVTVTNAKGPWTSDNRQVSHATPILVNEGSAPRRRFESAFDEFRRIFPAALCYTKIVPVDEVVTLTLFYREDRHLARLMLNETQKAKIDRLWDELHFVSHDALDLVDAFEQLWQYATQDADPKVFEPLRKPIQERAAAFRLSLIDSEPKHLDALLEFAGRAYRRPLTGEETEELRRLYRNLRTEELPHEQAIRLVLARVLVSPAFLYRLERAGPGKEPAPVSDWELANRLSYFLWSSLPDPELRELAAGGNLHNTEVLMAQTRRMLREPKTRRLAVEFACQWLHIHGFDTLDEKSERHFPTFNALRADMYEESIQFFTDLFQRDGSVLEILDADHTFLNESLAQHYGIAGISGAEWRRVEGVKTFSRGGILGHASTLAKQSGASRTSPILRGNWVAEALLGDRLPRPPKDVPRLPEDETATEGLTVRQLTEKHSTDPSCFGCHARIDPFGYALESFDAIGRRREKDLGDRTIDTRAKALDRVEFEDIYGLRDYLLNNRRDDFICQFCRKILGYALGRAVQISDRPLLTEMQAQLSANNYRVGAAVETIVRSAQFRQIRGRDAADEE